MNTRWVAYLIPTLFTIYGVLTINGIKVPKIPLEHGYIWLNSGIFLYFLVLFGHIRAIRREKSLKAIEDSSGEISNDPSKQLLSIEHDKAITFHVQICKGVAFVFIGYIALSYSDFPYTNDFIFMLISGSMVYCLYKLLEKIKNKKDTSNDLDK